MQLRRKVEKGEIEDTESKDVSLCSFSSFVEVHFTQKIGLLNSYQAPNHVHRHGEQNTNRFPPRTQLPLKHFQIFLHFLFYSTFRHST